jgi:hypothetical protein
MRAADQKRIDGGIDGATPEMPSEVLAAFLADLDPGYLFMRIIEKSR